MPSANELRLDDGFSTIVTIENLPTAKFFEKEVTPPGYAANGPIDTTTMRNIAYRTQAPKQLKSVTNISMTAAYATEVLEQIWAQIGVNQLITVTFPDGSELAVYGWIDDFKPNAHVEGEQPTASLTVICGMRDNTGAEVAPLYTSPES